MALKLFHILLFFIMVMAKTKSKEGENNILCKINLCYKPASIFQKDILCSRREAVYNSRFSNRYRAHGHNQNRKHNKKNTGLLDSVTILSLMAVISLASFITM